MNLRRCKKGHFYNAEQFLKCPYCAGIMEFKGDNDNDDDDAVSYTHLTLPTT